MALDSGNALSSFDSRDEGVHPQGSQDADQEAGEKAVLVVWQLVYTKQAQKDAKKLSSAGLRSKAEELLAVLEENPFQNPPPFEKLVGDLAGAYSRRINIHHRLVYQVIKNEKVVKVIRMWTHYE